MTRPDPLIFSVLVTRPDPTRGWTRPVVNSDGVRSGEKPLPVFHYKSMGLCSQEILLLCSNGKIRNLGRNFFCNCWIIVYITLA